MIESNSQNYLTLPSLRDSQVNKATLIKDFYSLNYLFPSPFVRRPVKNIDCFITDLKTLERYFEHEKVMLLYKFIMIFISKYDCHIYARDEQEAKEKAFAGDYFIYTNHRINEKAKVINSKQTFETVDNDRLYLDTAIMSALDLFSVKFWLNIEVIINSISLNRELFFKCNTVTDVYSFFYNSIVSSIKRNTEHEHLFNMTEEYIVNPIQVSDVTVENPPIPYRATKFNNVKVGHIISSVCIKYGCDIPIKWQNLIDNVSNN